MVSIEPWPVVGSLIPHVYRCEDRPATRHSSHECRSGGYGQVMMTTPLQPPLDPEVDPDTDPMGDPDGHPGDDPDRHDPSDPLDPAPDDPIRSRPND